MKIIVVHYSEIALKGNNRVYFEKQLVNNIRRACPRKSFREINRLRGRIVIYLSASCDTLEVQKSLATIFGISHFSFGLFVNKDIETLKEEGWKLLKELTFDSFKVRTKRAQKEYPLTSVQINQQVGAFIVEKSGKKVDLGNSDETLFIEIAEKGALLYLEKVKGLGGLPVGTNEAAVSLLSSGIDSPVSSYMILKRGVKLIYAHFHSQPYTNPASQENTEKIIEQLTRFQLYAKAYFIPFIDIQKEIMAKAPSALRVLLYRRYMVRLSERIAKIENAKALVTGENVGQVASQTISNIRVVAEVTGLPILRPLAGFDKDEIIERAKEIGTFDISIQPYEDCCSLFVPKNPATKASPKELYLAEKSLEMDVLLDRAIEQSEIKEFRAASIEASKF